MDIKKYLSIRGNQALLASKTGLATPFIWQIANGDRPVPAAHAFSIEQATLGEVTRKDMFPETWQKLWPELATSTPALMPHDGVGVV